MPIAGGLKFALGGSPPIGTCPIPGGIIPGKDGGGLGGAIPFGIPGGKALPDFWPSWTFWRGVFPGLAVGFPPLPCGF